MTIDKAISELNSRIDLWTEYPDKVTAEYFATLRMSRDTLVREKRNRILQKKMLTDIAKLPPGSQLSDELAYTLIKSFNFGDDDNDPSRS